MSQAPMPLLVATQAMERMRLARQKYRPGDYYEPGRRDFKPADRFQLQFHRSRHIIRAMFPGNGAGKTTVAAMECEYWLQHKHPFQETPDWPVQIIWVALKYTQMDMLRQQLEQTCFTGGWVWNEQKHRYRWPNGSELYIISNDGDWATIQGVNPDLVIVDEECDEKLWRELVMRRRGRRKTRYVISATATKGKRWMFNLIYKPWMKRHERDGLGEDQAVTAQKHPTRWVWPRGGIEDNPGGSRQDLQWYEGELALASAAERQVRLKGGFQDFNASPVFNLDVLRQMEELNVKEKIKPIDGSFEPVPIEKRRNPSAPAEFRFVPGMPIDRGRITIMEMPADDNYALGADFGYGLLNRDQDACAVFRHSTGKQVAAASGNWGDSGFAWVIWALAWFYNQALIVGERQVGLPTLRRLYDEWNYRFIYYQKDQEHAAVRHSDLLGHHANSSDLVVAQFSVDIAPRDEVANKLLASRIRLTDPQTIEQCRAFEWKPRRSTVDLATARSKELKHEAPAGELDDMVFASAYAAMGLRELPKFIADKPRYAAGSLGQVLGHGEVWQRSGQLDRPRKSAFSHAKVAGKGPSR